jgi:hypothetical protein
MLKPEVTTVGVAPAGPRAVYLREQLVRGNATIKTVGGSRKVYQLAGNVSAEGK